VRVDLSELTIDKTYNHLRGGDFSAVDLAESYLKNIKEKNRELNAYLEVFDDVKEQARVADGRIKDGEATALTGIPVAVKDNILIEGRRVSAGSRILENYTAAYDATVVKRLKDAGVVFLGRTNMDEFAMGSSTEHSAYGVTKNPHDLSRVPGGTSGGSTTAVAAALALVALGSDTGGSIRQPSSFCGVVGLKPTYGGVSRSGLIAAASSFDQIGTIGKTVGDVEVLFSVIKGHDPLDSTSLQEGLYGQKKVGKKLTIGVPMHFIEEGIDEDVSENFNSALERFKSLGYAVKEITLTSIKYSLSAYYILMFAESSTNLARFDGVRFGLHRKGGALFEDYTKTRGEGFGEEVRRRILLGTYVLSAGYYDAYYSKANAVRRLITTDFESAFKDVDVILSPTSPTPAFKIGEKSDPLSMYLSDIFTVPANLTGMPAISVPSGTVLRDGKDLPVGVQLLAPAAHEHVLFKAGKDFLGEPARMNIRSGGSARDAVQSAADGA